MEHKTVEIPSGFVSVFEVVSNFKTWGLPQKIMKYKWRSVLPKVYSLHNLNYLVAEGRLIYGLGFAVRAFFTIAWSLVLVFTRSFFSISKQALWCFHPFLLHLSSVYYHRFISTFVVQKPSLVFNLKNYVCYRCNAHFWFISWSWVMSTHGQRIRNHTCVAHV